MITKVTDFTHKSFKNYTNPEDLLFRFKNIVFGYNGKGKSALTYGIRQEFLKDTSKIIDNIRVFDSDYVSNSLLLENSDSKIKGVEANFGKPSVDTENKIKELENQIISQEDINKIETNITQLREEIRNAIDEIHDRRKGDAKIQKKPQNESVEKVIELYIKDYNDAKKIEPDDEKLLKIVGDDTIEKQIAQIENLKQLTFSKVSSSIIEDVKAIFKEEFGEDISIPAYEVVQWIEAGLKIHKEGDNCKFCSGQLNYSAVASKFNQYKENKKQKAIEKLKEFENQLKNTLDSIKNVEKESNTYSINLGSDITNHFNAISAKQSELETLIISCQSKIKNIENQEIFNSKLLTEILELIEASINAINEIKKAQLNNLIKKQNKFTSLVKGAIGLEIKNSKFIKDKLNELESKEKELQGKKESNKLKEKEILELKQQKSLTKDFADFITNILNDLNISLQVSLDTDNRNYIIKSTKENVTLTIKDISEGEKNLLALLFFYYELFSDNKQQEIKPEIELIIVDDPISSMDDSNKFYILELIKSLLELNDVQTFVFTHSWDDFCNLSYGKKSWEPNQPYATFEIRKINGKSELKKLTGKEKPYKHLFKEIYWFSKKSVNEISSECEIYHYPNVMRRIFEEWYSFKTGKNLNFTGNIQKELESVFNITDNNQKRKLGTLIKVCNILSHSINASMNPVEIHQSAKFLMNLIKDKDEIHFNNMKN